MANNHPKIGKPTPSKAANAATNISHPSALKVDERTAMEFSQLLQRRSDNEKGMLQERELQASDQQGRTQAQLNSASVQPTNSAPDMFFQSQATQRHNIIEEPELQNTQVVDIEINQGQAPASMGAINVQDTHTRPAIEQIVETIYRDWQSQQASTGTQQWSMQLNTATSLPL